MSIVSSHFIMLVILTVSLIVSAIVCLILNYWLVVLVKPTRFEIGDRVSVKNSTYFILAKQWFYENKVYYVTKDNYWIFDRYPEKFIKERYHPSHEAIFDTGMEPRFD